MVYKFLLLLIFNSSALIFGGAGSGASFTESSKGHRRLDLGLRIEIPSDDHAKKDVLLFRAIKKPDKNCIQLRKKGFNSDFNKDDLKCYRIEKFRVIYSKECQMWAMQTLRFGWLTPTGYKFGPKKGFKSDPKNNLGRFLLLHTEKCCRKR